MGASQDIQAEVAALELWLPDASFLNDVCPPGAPSSYAAASPSHGIGADADDTRSGVLSEDGEEDNQSPSQQKTGELRPLSLRCAKNLDESALI